MKAKRRKWFRLSWVALGLLLGGWLLSGCLNARHFAGNRNSASATELETRLRSSVQALAGDIGERNAYRTRNAERAAEWIVTNFQAAGYSNVRTQEFKIHDAFRLDATNIAAVGKNFAVELSGGATKQEIIVVGARYDTIGYSRQWSGDDTNEFRLQFPGTPGANDNASGVAALIELARMLSERARQTSRFARTIRFVAFDSEEPPFFQERNVMGSSVYAQRSRALNEKIVMMISLDAMAVYSRTLPNKKRAWYVSFLRPIFGLKAEPDYVAFMSNWDAGSGKNTINWARSFARHSRVDVRTLSLPFMPRFGKEIFAWSDDWSFTRVHYPAFTVTDTAFYRSDRYHELWDTPENLTAHDYECFAQVVAGLAGMLQERANAK